MGTFQLSIQAKNDLKTIAVYTQHKWGKAQRRIYLRQFDDAFHSIAETPAIGITCDFVRPGYRKFPVTSHIVFYRKVSDTHIEIVRILHKRMDAKPSLLKP
ncbi:type II toxin-antitoxin system RelE/ParE family toxin [uncultured Gilvimarinus sp.]|uniref:type II toxin-antitoxin system RelE/ParE family toxin n=1 Tax=uncultured Gilvimarinus sp. TaxID=1689143 RepID=UPI0030ED52F3|tara:strand:- start:801 stop:1103 length:303 start_codon:yes stop_codon:yes gene_type:complete